MSGTDIVNYFKNKYTSSNSNNKSQSNSMMNDLKKSQNNSDDDSIEQTMTPSGNSTKKENIYDSERGSNIHNDSSSQASNDNEMSM